MFCFTLKANWTHCDLSVKNEEKYKKKKKQRKEFIRSTVEINMKKMYKCVCDRNKEVINRLWLNDVRARYSFNCHTKMIGHLQTISMTKTVVCLIEAGYRIFQEYTNERREDRKKPILIYILQIYLTFKILLELFVLYGRWLLHIKVFFFLFLFLFLWYKFILFTVIKTKPNWILFFFRCCFVERFDFLTMNLSR